jgi:hypothetical protein
MTTVAVVPAINALSETTYHAIAGNKQASGKTMGEALDALTLQLEDDDNAATLVVVQKQRPDRFFTAEQQQRREELMTQWRVARDANQEISAEAQAELEQLVLAEVRAAGQRAAALLKDAGQ